MAKPQSLVNLCLGVLTQHFEDIFVELNNIAANFSFPPEIKMALAAIARRKRLLNDDFLILLAGSSWEILDVSGSDVSDFGLAKVAKICKSLKAVDIRRCSKITGCGVSELVGNCRSLEILRCGGCPKSNNTAQNCLVVFKLKLSTVERDSWEEFDDMEIHNGAQSLRWLVWPEINDEVIKRFATECPRIVVNPNSSHLSCKGLQVPKAAQPDVALDETTVKGIDFKLCGDSEVTRLTATSASCTTGLSMDDKSVTACSGVVPQVVPIGVKHRRQHMRHAKSKNLVEEPMHNPLDSDNVKELHLGDEEFFEPDVPVILEQYMDRPKHKRATKKKKKDRRIRPDFGI